MNDFSTDLYARFSYESGKIIYDIQKMLNPVGVTYYDFMSGLKFLNCVECGGFIDYDGELSEVIVDGAISNLGLKCGGLAQGEFVVDGDTFRTICNEHDVKVNWANK
jgi:hypothetical protein